MKTLHCGDCLEWLRTLETDAVDVIFTSPPYTGARTYEWLRPIVQTV